MTEVAIEKERRPIAEWLPRRNSDELVYLTRRDRKKSVVGPLDDMDEEVIAIRKNAALMEKIHKLSERARKGPTSSIEEVREELGIARRNGKRRGVKKSR